MNKSVFPSIFLSLLLIVSFAGDRRCYADEYSQVSESYEFLFPRSHGSHPGYATEWWYFTGHAETATQRTFGFELTFFRVGVNPKGKNKSAWGVQSLFLAHFAITDDKEKQFYSAERISRDAFSKAAAAEDTLDVHLDSWRAQLGRDGTLSIRAEDEHIAISFDMKSNKPPALHGKGGFSKKGPGKHDASYYSSFTRLVGDGSIRIGKENHAISRVEAWMDHEVTSSKLARGVDGWDWFAIQLESGEEIMLYQLRLPERAVSPYSSGSIIDRRGRVENLALDDFSIEVHDHWISPQSNIRYPSSWTLSIPDKQIRLRVTPTIPGQEMLTKKTTGVSYWEGRCLVRGEIAGKDTSGNAYVELVGYEARK